MKTLCEVAVRLLYSLRSVVLSVRRTLDGMIDQVETYERKRGWL